MRTSLLIVALLAGCAHYGASPEVRRPFPLDPSYTEILADPGVVNQRCYTPGGRHDNGRFQSWNDDFCECVNFRGKDVLISRHPKCMARIDELRQHAYCHIVLGESKEARKLCD